jgi:hypothetical protein
MATSASVRRVASIAAVVAALVAAYAVGPAWAEPQPEAAQQPLRLPTPLRRRTVVLPILMYHRINVVNALTPSASHGLTVHPAVFARQMRWLAAHG